LSYAGDVCIQDGLFHMLLTSTTKDRSLKNKLKELPYWRISAPQVGAIHCVPTLCSSLSHLSHLSQL